MIGRTIRGLVAATVLVAAVSSAAEAQETTSPRFGVKAGVAMPMGDFGDVAGLGIHAGAHLGMALGTSGMWGLRFDVDYGTYGGEDPFDDSSLLGGTANIILNVTTESAWKPYIIGGLGYYNYDISGFDDSDMAFQVGAGFNFTMGAGNWFTELRFLSVQTEGDAINTLPIVIGLRF
jgi:opacity protein-like surface antigen